MPPRVGLRCDASPEMGVGHLVRCLALADALRSRESDVVLLGSVPAPAWVREEVLGRGLDPVSAAPDPSELLQQVRGHHVDGVVLDGYHLARGTGSALRAGGVPVMAIVDGGFGHQEADLYVDQNLGATDLPDRPRGSMMLAGPDFSMLRASILSRRGMRPEESGARPPHVLVLLGGTDAKGAAVDVVRLVLASGCPAQVVVVANNPSAAHALASLACGPGQSLDVTPPLQDLAALAVQCDVALSAAGSSLLELLYLGVPTGLVQVADNQAFGYAQAMARGVAVPLGRLGDLRASERARASATAEVRTLLTDADRRAVLRRRGSSVVDGHGGRRVADALLRLVESKS